MPVLFSNWAADLFSIFNERAEIAWGGAKTRGSSK
jgi:hypothetical protein